MLCGENDCINTDNFAVVVLERHLAFCVRAQPRQGAVFAYFSLTLHQTVSVGDRRRHQHIGFVSRIAKHQALVARALLQRIGAVNALVDVRRLFTDSAQHRAGVGVKAHIGMHVANFTDRIAGDLFDINPGAGSDFATHQNHAGFDVGFTCYARFWILFKDRIQHGVGDLVSNFVGMPFGYGL